MEIIVALALFALLVGMALPLIMQTGRNMHAAEERYIHQLLAQEMLVLARVAVLNGQAPHNILADFANENNIYAFGVWLVGNETEAHLSVGMPPLTVSYTGNNLGGKTIIIALSNQAGDITARAIGKVWQ